jgi:hypothetical protein
MEPAPDIDQLAADWITLWESEVAALAQDADLAEAWAAGVALMAAYWRAQTSGMAAAMKWVPPIREPSPEAPRPAPAATPPAAGPGAGAGGADDAAALLARLAELERRLASVEGRAGGSPTDRPRARRAAPKRKPRRT